MYVAKEILHLETEERPIPLEEVAEFAEGGLCGTAAVISPIGSITTSKGVITMPSGLIASSMPMMLELPPPPANLYQTGQRWPIKTKTAQSKW
jgi:hypothetical protein